MQAMHRSEIAERVEDARNVALKAMNDYYEELRRALSESYTNEPRRIKHYAECLIRVDRALDGMKRLDAKHN